MIGSLKASMIGFVIEIMNRYFFETPLADDISIQENKMIWRVGFDFATYYGKNMCVEA